VDAGTLRGMRMRVQLYTVPGQVHYNATRQVVLRGVDAVVFVADSQRELLRANREAWENLKDNLALQGLSLTELPHVLQYNKRDLQDVLSIEELDELLNEFNAPFFEAVATTGVGVEETLQGVVKLVARSLRDRFKIPAEAAGAEIVEPVRAVPTAVPPPSPPLRSAPPSPVELIPPASIATPPLDLSTPPMPMTPPPAFDLRPPPGAFGRPPAAKVPPRADFMTSPPPPASAPPPPAFVMPPPPAHEPAPPLDLSEPPVAATPPARVFPFGPPAPAPEPEQPEPTPVEGSEVFEVELPEPVSVQTGRVMLPTAILTPEEEVAAVVPPAEEPPALSAPFEELPAFGTLAEELPAPVAPAGELAVLGDPFEAPAPSGGASGDVFQLEPPAPPAKVPELEFAAKAPPPLELSPEARGALVQRVVPRALAQVGEVRELELEVPVPAAWTGGKRLTLQLRLTLVPEEDTYAE